MRYDTLKGLLFILISETNYSLPKLNLKKVIFYTNHPLSSNKNLIFVTPILFRKKYFCDDFLLKWDEGETSFGINKKEIFNTLARGENMICNLNLKNTKAFVIANKLPKKNYVLVELSSENNSNLDCDLISNSIEKVEEFILRLI